VTDKKWLLPNAVDEILPPQAWQLEQKRRLILDYMVACGYDLITPSLFEFLDSLLTGAGKDLDRHTFKVTDQSSGRTLGFRADMTTQAARIDAHLLSTSKVTRLCYVGEVVHTRTDELAGSRNPIQIGAECYGHQGICADAEIISLMIETLKIMGLKQISLDLGHVGIFRELAKQAALTPEQEKQIFNALQRKAIPEIEQMLATFDLNQQQAEMLLALAELNGNDILALAQQKLAKAGQKVADALAEIAEIIDFMKAQMPEIQLHIDLAELRGYHFHTGVVFAAFVPKLGREIARGGRYNGVGKSFGSARFATGFSANLKQLFRLSQEKESETDKRVLAPAKLDTVLMNKINELRHAGYRVIRALGTETASDLKCQQELVLKGNDWVLQKIQII